MNNIHMQGRIYNCMLYTVSSSCNYVYSVSFSHHYNNSVQYNSTHSIKVACSSPIN